MRRRYEYVPVSHLAFLIGMIIVLFFYSFFATLALLGLFPLAVKKVGTREQLAVSGSRESPRPTVITAFSKYIKVDTALEQRCQPPASEEKFTQPLTAVSTPSVDTGQYTTGDNK